MSHSRKRPQSRSAERSPFQTFTTVLTSEIRKVLFVQWSYRFNALFAVLSEIVAFLGAVFLVGGGRPSHALIASSALGYIVTSYARQLVTTLAADQRSEARAGTLEQMHMTVTPMYVPILGNLIAVFIAATIRLAISILGLILFFRLQLPFRWEGVVVLAITLVGLAGLGYLAAGLLHILKQTKTVVTAMTLLLSFVNGTYLTLDQLPSGLALVSRFLPTTQGIVVLRRVTLEGASLTDVFMDGSLIFLINHSVALLFLGRFVFLWGENVARVRAVLGQY
jgi:ABC-2 type transport system permease protein